jgi:hypothetical protein
MHNAIPFYLAALIAVSVLVIGCFYFVSQIRFRKAKKVVQVARVSAVDHGFEFSREQFLGGQNEKLARLRITSARSWKHARGQSTGAHQKIDFDLYAIRGTGVVGVAKMPFP